MKRLGLAFGVCCLISLTSCQRPANSRPPQPANAGAQPPAPGLDERLLTGLDARRQWPTNEVKINLATPEVAVDLRGADGATVRIYAWASNDYSVPMMRLDAGQLLYELTDEEWRQLQERDP